MDAPVSSGVAVSGLTSKDEVLDRLSVTPAFTLEPDFFDVLYDLRDKNTSVLVIDNIATLFRDGLMGATVQGTSIESILELIAGHAAMMTAMEEVAALTYRSGMLTIVGFRSRREY